MTEDQIRQLNRRLDSIDANQLAMTKKIDPMYEVFVSVNGFNRVAVLIMKGLATLGAAILALYVVIEFFKKLGK